MCSAHATALMEARGQFVGVHVGPRHQTEVIRLEGECSYPLSHLAGPYLLMDNVLLRNLVSGWEHSSVGRTCLPTMNEVLGSVASTV